MERRGIKRMISIIIIYIILLLFIISLFFYIIPEIVRDTGDLSGILPQYSMRLTNTIQYIQNRYTAIGIPNGIKDTIDNNINRFQVAINRYFNSIANGIISFLSKILNYILIPFLLYYFLKDYNRIGYHVKMLIPRKYRNQTTRIWGNIDDVFGDYIRSQLLLSGVIAVLSSIALILIRVDFALILGILNGITNIIPYFGPIIGALPAVLIALLQSPSKALYTAIALFLIQQFESGILSPKITGESVDLHPVTVILALIAGEELFGMTGMILSVPIAAAIKVIYMDIYKNLF
jgi:Predicted permease